MTPQQAYKAGNITEALLLSSQLLKKSPNDCDTRIFLAEMYCIVGDFERAEQQLKTLLMLSPDLALSVGGWRQLIRAAYARQAVYSQGIAPTLINHPNASIESTLSMLVALLEKDASGVMQALKKNHGEDQNKMWCINGETKKIFRDLDDLHASTFEFLGSNGNYFWINFDDIESLVFEVPQRPLDLLWRKCDLILNSGTQGSVFMPAIYPFTQKSPESQLGLNTQWDSHFGCEMGQGLREFLVDDEPLTVMELTSIVRI